jgi:hypothetical protein
MPIPKPRRSLGQGHVFRAAMVEGLELRLLLAAPPGDPGQTTADESTPPVFAVAADVPQQAAGEEQVDEEVSPAAILRVQSGAQTLASGQKTRTSFGSAMRGTAGPSRTFTLHNDGDAPLTLGTITIPKGFKLRGPRAANVAPGGSTTFTVTLKTAAVGKFAGNVSIAHDGGAAGPSKFVFPIGGAVTVWVPNLVGHYEGDITIKKWFVSKSFDVELDITEQQGTRIKGTAKIERAGSNIPFTGTLNSTLRFTIRWDHDNIEGQLNGAVSKNGRRIWGSAEIDVAIDLDGDFELDRVGR